METSFKKVGIIGLGLIGGSIAKSIKAAFPEINIVGSSRTEPALSAAKKDGTISDYSLKDMSIFSDCDIIFLCTPVNKIISYVDALIPHIKSDCIITDAGSTKNGIYTAMLNYKNIKFIGGHPMAGSEKTSYNASSSYLFENAYYVLTPSPYVSKNDINETVGLVKAMKAIPVVIDAAYHDHIVSAISHVPHVLAAALVNMVKKLDNEDNYMHTLAAGGFKDMTRIASSSPEMWSAISFENKKEILNVISAFKETLSEYEAALKSDDNSAVYDFFSSSKEYRNSFHNKKNTLIPEQSEIVFDVADRVGIIAKIASILSENSINIKNISINNNREFTGGVLKITLENDTDRQKSLNLLKEYKII